MKKRKPPPPLVYRPYRELPVGHGVKVGVPVGAPTLLMAEVMTVPMEDYLRSELVANLQQQVENDEFQKMAPHFERWALMRYALDNLHKPWDTVAEWCARQLKKSGQHISPSSVLRSYKKIESWQRQLGRGRPRTYRKRRLG